MYNIDSGVVDFKFPVPSPLLGNCFSKDKGKPAPIFYYIGMYCAASIYTLSANDATDIWLCAAIPRVAMDAGILCCSAILALEPHDSAPLGLISSEFSSLIS